MVTDEPLVRGVSLRSRIVGVAVAGVLVAGLIGIAAVITIARSAAAADDAARFERAAVRNDGVTDDLRRVERVLTGVDNASDRELTSLLDRTASSAATVVPLAAGVDGGALTDASAATQRYLDRAAGLGTGATTDGRTEGFVDAVAARRDLGAELGAAADDATGRVDSARTTGLAVVLAILVLGVVALLAVGVGASTAVIDPLRRLGRSMRRFGDGDLSERGVVTADEIGTLARSFNHLADNVSRNIRRLSTDAQWGTQLRVISEALDLADNEADVHRIVEHAMAMLAPSTPMELLVDDADSQRLHQVAVSPTGGPPNCPVETAAGCVAIRRGQTVVFETSEVINACPRLRGRPTGPCSGTCVPVAQAGHLLGVIHATGPDGTPPDPGLVEQLGVLAGQAGARIGALRTLATTRLEAATDILTGLANRRSLEAHLGDLIRTATPFVLAVADLDRFKVLNDTYGHEVGDRALQLFAKVLLDNVRDHDVVSRLGGEEFVIVLPSTPVSPAIEAIERIRNALATSVVANGFPPFTCSFGVTHSSVADDVDGVIRIADAGLLMAKELGRDRIVVADAELAAEVFSRHPEVHDSGE